VKDLVVCRTGVKGRKNQRGFTLIELLVAVSLIALIAGIAITRVSATQAQAKRKAALTQMQNLRNALENYKFDQNGYPAQTNITNWATLKSTLQNYISLPANAEDANVDTTAATPVSYTVTGTAPNDSFELKIYFKGIGGQGYCLAKPNEVDCPS
jgi:prepilin-type N-terminal cleavage/methylation domain-containing protein